jgi:membrane-bound lytic murein transglycosylase B
VKSRWVATLLLLGALGAAGAVHGGEAATSTLRPEIEEFIQAFSERHEVPDVEVRLILRHARVEPGILRAMSAQATPRPWHLYRPVHVNPQRIVGGVRFWARHAELLARAEREYGVPAELIVATIGIETVYGGFTGTHRVLDALTTLAFDFPRRAEFFRGELEQFLLLARDRVVDPLRLKGSYAGAMGIPQFMPSSFQRYAVDFDGDGRRTLWEGVADSIGSVANYYRTFGWQSGEPVVVGASVEGTGYRELAQQGIEPKITAPAFKAAGVTPHEDLGERGAAMLVLEAEAGPLYLLGLNNFYVITRYNRSTNYALAVHRLAEAIRTAREAAGSSP